MIRRILGVSCAIAVLALSAASAQAAPIAGIKATTITQTVGYRTAYDGDYVYWVRTLGGKKRNSTGDDVLYRTSVIDGTTAELFRAPKAQHETIGALQAGGGVVAFTLVNRGDLDPYDLFAQYEGNTSKIIRIKGDGSPPTLIASGALNSQIGDGGGITSSKTLDDCGTFEYLTDVTETGAVIYGENTHERDAVSCGSLPNRNRLRYVSVATDDAVNELFTTVTTVKSYFEAFGKDEYEVNCDCAATGMKSVKVAGTFALVFDQAGGQLLDLATGLWTKKYKTPKSDYFIFDVVEPSVDAAGHVVAKFLDLEHSGAPDFSIGVPSSNPKLYPIAADPGKQLKLVRSSKPVFCDGRLISALRNKKGLAVLSELDPATGAKLRTIGTIPFRGPFAMAACSSQYLFAEESLERGGPLKKNVAIHAIPLG
jgi:hypothetical protein